MRAATKDDIPEIQSFMKDFWDFVKETWHITNNDDAAWRYVLDTTNDIDAGLKHEGQRQFCRWMLLSYCDFLEQRRQVQIGQSKSYDYVDFYENKAKEAARKMIEEQKKQ